MRHSNRAIELPADFLFALGSLRTYIVRGFSASHSLESSPLSHSLVPVRSEYHIRQQLSVPSSPSPLPPAFLLLPLLIRYRDSPAPIVALRLLGRGRRARALAAKFRLKALVLFLCPFTLTHVDILIGAREPWAYSVLQWEGILLPTPTCSYPGRRAQSAPSEHSMRYAAPSLRAVSRVRAAAARATADRVVGSTDQGQLAPAHTCICGSPIDKAIDRGLLRAQGRWTSDGAPDCREFSGSLIEEGILTAVNQLYQGRLSRGGSQSLPTVFADNSGGIVGRFQAFV